MGSPRSDLCIAPAQDTEQGPRQHTLPPSWALTFPTTPSRESPFFSGLCSARRQKEGGFEKKRKV